MSFSKLIGTISGVATLTLTLHAASIAPLHARCTIGASEDAGKFKVEIDKGDCEGMNHCGSNFSNESLSRFTGITLGDLSREGANLTATLSEEAGIFTCSGKVHDGELSGSSMFTPDPGFVEKMDQMGYGGLDSEKLQAYAFLGVGSAWVRSIKETGVRGINIDNLIALRIFRVDPDYVHGITALGYDLPNADQLIGLKVQGVNTEEVRQIRALGFQPTLDELVQIRIFHITPDFIHRMQDRGLKNLTIGKLVQIRIFKLDE